MNSEPFCCRSSGSIGPVAPEELPKVTNSPRGFKLSSEAVSVAAH